MEQIERTLEEQRREFSNRKFLATPLAGMIVWLLIGISGILFPVRITVWVIYIGTGSIVYLGMLISRFTGENFLDKKNQKTHLTHYSSLQLEKRCWFIPLHFLFFLLIILLYQ